MFLLDSLMISGISWALRTAITAAEAEMNDDSALREALLEAEMRREMGEIGDDEFADIEADLLTRIREIKERREGGSGPLAFGAAQPMETSPDSKFQIEASVSGDFYEPADAPHTTVLDHQPGEDGLLVRADRDEAVQLLDMQPGDAAPAEEAALPLTPEKPSRRPARRPATRRTSGRATRTARAASRLPRTPSKKAAGGRRRAPTRK